MNFKKMFKGGGHGYIIIPHTQEGKEGKHSKNVSSLFCEVTL